MRESVCVRECAGSMGSLGKRSPETLKLPHEFDHDSECFFGPLDNSILTEIASLVLFFDTISPVIAILASLAMLAPLPVDLVVEGWDSGSRILGNLFVGFRIESASFHELDGLSGSWQVQILIRLGSWHVQIDIRLAFQMRPFHDLTSLWGSIIGRSMRLQYVIKLRNGAEKKKIAS